MKSSKYQKYLSGNKSTLVILKSTSKSKLNILYIYMYALYTRGQPISSIEVYRIPYSTFLLLSVFFFNQLQ